MKGTVHTFIYFLKAKISALIVALVMFCGFNTQAQQDPQFTMFMFNQQYFNPAFAGSVDFLNVTMFYRRQWVGIDGSPSNPQFSGTLPMKRKHMAVGLNLLNDEIGITGMSNFNAVYSYYVNIGQGRLCFGLSAGLLQTRMNYDALNDQQLKSDQSFTGYRPNYQPDFGFGVYYKSQRMFAGISSQHLTSPSRKFTDYGRAAVARHYYITAGYNIEMNEKFVLTPMIISRFSESQVFTRNFNADFVLKVEYMEMVWLGSSYRTGDALNFFVGLNVGKIKSDAFKQPIKIGYGFDWTNSRVPTFNNGTHEIFVSWDFVPKVKRMMPKFK
ncbi:MAG: type IX secretion system membrane protein PorP/SprF [Bacteroidota bacterium]|nr:type IX secretion system membrane protein PorP/SprF [Bacteroidota bacterium]